MGFHHRWITLVMACISTVRFTILHDGKELGPIVPRKGLRQGDPLSPFLFIICAEALSLLIRAKESFGCLNGCKIARGAPPISHLFFSDKCFLYFRVTKFETCIIKQTLLEYGLASGQKVNFNKSSNSFSRNVDPIRQDLFCSILEVRGTSEHIRYLGIP